MSSCNLQYSSRGYNLTPEEKVCSKFEDKTKLKGGKNLAQKKITLTPLICYNRPEKKYLFCSPEGSEMSPLLEKDPAMKRL